MLRLGLPVFRPRHVQPIRRHFEPRRRLQLRRVEELRQVRRVRRHALARASPSCHVPSQHRRQILHLEHVVRHVLTKLPAELVLPPQQPGGERLLLLVAQHAVHEPVEPLDLVLVLADLAELQLVRQQLARPVVVGYEHEEQQPHGVLLRRLELVVRVQAEVVRLRRQVLEKVPQLLRRGVSHPL